MLSKKEKTFLKSKAQSIDNRYLVGKELITPELINMLNKALDAKELIKIGFQNSVSDNLNELALDLVSKLNAELIQIIGHVVIVFRKKRTNSMLKNG